MFESFAKKFKDKKEKFLDWLSFRIIVVLFLTCWEFIHAFIPSFEEFRKTGNFEIFFHSLSKNQNNFIKAFKVSAFYLCILGIVYITYAVLKRAWLSEKAGLKNYYFGKDILNTLGEKIAKASHVSILLITGHDSFGLQEPTEIKKALSEFRGEGEARILIMEPNCPELQQRAKDVRKESSTAEEEMKFYNEQAERNKKFFKKLRDEEKRNVDFGTYNERPIWKMFIIDNELYLQSYPIKKHSDFAPIFHFSKGKNSSLYSNFCKVFQKKWQNRTKYAQNTLE